MMSRLPLQRRAQAAVPATALGITDQSTTLRRVLAKVVTWISAASVAVALSLAIASAEPANAAPPRAAAAVTSVAHPVATHVASAQPAASNPWGVTASKTWAFTQCIFAVGVPIGLVYAIATSPSVWAYVLGYKPQPTIGRSIDRYLSFVKSRCGYALR